MNSIYKKDVGAVVNVLLKTIFFSAIFVFSAYANEIEDLKKIINEQQKVLEEQKLVIDSLLLRMEAVEKKSEGSSRNGRCSCYSY